ncbi:MAG: thiamine-monophosphate kinase [Chloroflexi bacterium]|nr:thiamine-monophosphate kinase [Chloroflexota bacterium]
MVHKRAARRASSLGEFSLIEILARTLAESSGADSGIPGLVLGIGDDCAVVRRGSLTDVYTTDTMVDGVHFHSGQIPWRDLGWKSIAVNLSDVASMGARPVLSLVTLGLTGDEDISDLEEIYRGIGEITREFGGSVAGGDIVRSPVLFITVAMTGEAAVTVGGAAFNRARLMAGSMTGTTAGAGYPTAASQLNFDRGTTQAADGAALLRRDAASVGDQIAVTGTIGDSGGGVRVLADGLDGLAADALKRAHFRPAPRMAAGVGLVTQGVLAAMDVSDGLVDDLGKLCRASGVAAKIRMPAVPVSDELKACFPDSYTEIALSGGEDYELLFTAPEPVMAAVLPSLGVRASVIGEVVDGEPGVVTVIDERGRPLDIATGGWDHLDG